MVKRGALNSRIDALYYKSSKSLDLVTKSIYPQKKLSEIAELKRGRFSHRPRNAPEFYGGKYPFIQTGDIVKASNEGGDIIFTQTLNELGLSVSKLFEPNILVMTIAANIGDTAILTYPACFPDSLVTIKPKTEVIDVYYLNILFTFLKEYLNEIAPQTAQKNINLQQLSPVPIVVPPLEIQFQIVEIFNTAYTEKRQKETEAKELLASMDAYLLEQLGIVLPDKVEDKNVFYVPFSKVQGSRFDPFYHRDEFEINNDAILKGKYKVETIKEICKNLIKGRLPKDSEKDGSCKVVQINSVKIDGSIDLEDLLTAKPIFTQNQLLRENDVLIVITGATIGKISFWQYEGEYYLGGDIVKFQCNEGVNPYYIYSYLRTQIIQTEIKRNITGATNGHLSPSGINNFQIPLPPLEIQTEIANHIRNIRERAKTLEIEAKEVIERAKAEVEKMILGE